MKKLILSILLCASHLAFAQPRDIRIDIYPWDTSLNEFSNQPNGYEEYKFDADSQVISFINFANGFANKFEYTYSNGKRTTEYVWKYNDQLMLWEKPTRIFYYYDEKGRDTLQWQESLNDNQLWEVNVGNRWTYHEDGNSRITEINREFYFANQWIQADGQEFIYDDADAVPEEIRFFGRFGGSLTYYLRWRCKDWEGRFNHLLTQRPAIYYVDNWNNGNWELMEYDSNVYFADSSLEYQYTIDYQTKQLKLQRVHHFHFDQFNNQTHFYTRMYRDFTIDTTYKLSHEINYIDGAWPDVVIKRGGSSTHTDYNEKRVYSYSPINNVNLVQGASCLVFPNPILSGQDLHLSSGEWSEIKLYSMQGSAMDIAWAPGDKVVRFPGLEPGIYFLVMQNLSGDFTTQKIQVVSK
ncbi:MAG: T9SS type A sorting domain-containing protein [Bacteroidota bacterium]|nr:T9SS type A sorting domain-containing protein [Bacteroidota bacterium]MDX5430936.1 T9SS type A sorting domain-containing protein [Bacteroidota bacterium]MDX5469684.1 T9SS type A sorting domain-containing protein [Bacteroidota bacterium]